jgi:hypothetical protein
MLELDVSLVNCYSAHDSLGFPVLAPRAAGEAPALPRASTRPGNHA